VGNKCDLEQKRQVSTDQGKEMAKQYGVQFFETSAKDQLNIDELFITTTKNFLEKQSNNKNTKSNNNNKNSKGMITIDDIKESKKSSNGCC
jgi:GTPase SAR1 family protein